MQAGDGATGTPAAGTRCAAHPARPAHDLCPTCGRPRCARDADGSDRCTLDALEGTGAGRTRAVPPLAALACTGVVGTLLGLLGAALGQEYVGAQYFSTIFPGIVGLVVAAAAAAVVGTPPARVRHAVAALCGAYAAVSALLDFRFTDLPYGPASRWAPPLVVSAVVAVVAAEVLVRRPAQPRKSISAIPPR